MKITKVDNGFIVEIGTSTYVAKTLEEVMDHALLHFEGRSAEFSSNSFGTVIILRCKCFKMDSESKGACSNCTERLAVLV